MKKCLLGPNMKNKLNQKEYVITTIKQWRKVESVGEPYKLDDYD